MPRKPKGHQTRAQNFGRSQPGQAVAAETSDDSEECDVPSESVEPSWLESYLAGLDYDPLNQIAQMFGLPAVSGAPVNQIARFLGFFVCFVCLLVSKDATQTQSWLLPRSLRVRRLRFSFHDAGACFSATFGPSCFRCLPEEASRYVQQPYSRSASSEVVAMKRGNVHSKRALFQRVFGS